MYELMTIAWLVATRWLHRMEQRWAASRTDWRNQWEVWAYNDWAAEWAQRQERTERRLRALLKRAR